MYIHTLTGYCFSVAIATAVTHINMWLCTMSFMTYDCDVIEGKLVSRIGTYTEDGDDSCTNGGAHDLQGIAQRVY